MAVVEGREETYKVTLEDGSEISYVVRGLKSEDEIGPWSEFCASIFSYKAQNPPPASYFQRHYANDPHREASLIRVAFLNGKMVASCRLFLRTISSGGSTCPTGKICFPRCELQDS